MAHGGSRGTRGLKALDFKAILAEVVADQLDDVLLIFDNDDALARGGIIASVGSQIRRCPPGFFGKNPRRAARLFTLNDTLALLWSVILFEHAKFRRAGLER